MKLLLAPLILPIAALWVWWQERRILAEGVPLDAGQLEIAQRLGIEHPGKVRLLSVSLVPLPGWRLARLAGPLIGTSCEHTAGLTARYGIFIQARFWGDPRLVAHELVHTAQYERLGGIWPFLRQYLHECLSVGYADAPMEREACEKARIAES